MRGHTVRGRHTVALELREAKEVLEKMKSGGYACDERSIAAQQDLIEELERELHFHTQNFFRGE